MKSRDIALLILFGSAFWFAGTLFYRVRGPMIFETTNLRYWINFLATPIVSSALCILLLNSLRIPDAQWAAASLLIALPGMAGEALILSRFTFFLPRMHEESGGNYGALLFASYALLLVIGEIVTMRVAGTGRQG